MTKQNPPLTWERSYAYERVANHHLKAANASNDCLERAFHLDEARKFAKKMGRAVEKAPSARGIRKAAP